MILSRRVALGGVQLDEIHEAIVIRSVDPGVTHETTNAVSRMGGFGQRVTGEHWETLDVNVHFAIAIPKKQLEERKAVFDSVMAWARAKGWLTFNYMTNRRMWVDKVIFPDSGDVWNFWQGRTLIMPLLLKKHRRFGFPDPDLSMRRWLTVRRRDLPISASAERKLEKYR